MSQSLLLISRIARVASDYGSSEGLSCFQTRANYLRWESGHIQVSHGRSVRYILFRDGEPTCARAISLLVRIGQNPRSSFLQESRKQQVPDVLRLTLRFPKKQPKVVDVLIKADDVTGLVRLPSKRRNLMCIIVMTTAESLDVLTGGFDSRRSKFRTAILDRILFGSL